MTTAVTRTDFPGLSLHNRGKVRDIYDLGDSLLLVATDRISAFDVVLSDPIPDKGRILTRISLFWFDAMTSIVENHLISADPADYPAACQPYRDQLEGRAMLVKKASPLPVECIVRGYLSGSGWKSYQRNGTVCGIQLPSGLRESDRLPEPIFTPSTKAETGHDENISFERMADMIGPELAGQVKDLSLAIYRRAVDIAEPRGIIIADTKFEFGLLDGRIILIDEVLTPDSSRFWPKDDYAPGGAQKSFDKQYLRDWLSAQDWDQTPPAPALPPEVIANTRRKYVEALRLLTGQTLG